MGRPDILDAGTLNDTLTAGLRPHDNELADIAFVPIDKAPTLLHHRIRNRLDAALQASRNGQPVYLHDGHAPFQLRPRGRWRHRLRPERYRGSSG